LKYRLIELYVIFIQLKEDLLQNEEKLRRERRQQCDTSSELQGCWRLWASI